MRVDADVIAAIADYVETNRETILNQLMELVRIPSVRGEPQPNAPFGAGPAGALSYCQTLFEGHGYQTEQDSGGKYALAQVGTGNKKIGVFCHCDTAGENGTWDYTTPFEPVIRNGVMIGRGVKDDKGAIISILHALQAIKKAGIELRNRVEVFLGSNEESGMEDIKQYLKENTMPEISLIPDCDFIVCRGEKSGYRFTTRSRKKFETIIDFTGTNTPGVVCRSAFVTLPNTPELLAELEAALENRTDASVSITDKGEVLLSTMGISAHSAVPMGSINGGAIAADILLKCPSLGDNDLEIIQTAYCMLGDYYGNFFHVAYPQGDFRPLTHIISLMNTVEGKLEFTVNLRCDPRNSFEWIQKKVKSTLHIADWDYMDGNYVGGMVKSRHHLAVQLMDEAYYTIVEEPSRGVYTSAGATYARELSNSYAIGIDAPQTRIPEDFRPGHGGLHQPDECIHVASFLKAIQVQALMILALDENLEQVSKKE